MLVYLLVFFFKHKTAYELRISDWSSDVCSSDLIWIALGAVHDVDGSLALADLGAEITDIGVDPKIARRREHRLEFQPPHLRVEILVHRRPVPDLGDLIILVIIIEAREIQGQRPVHQAVLGADFKGIDEFGLERRAIFHAGQRQRRKLVEEFKKVEIELSDAIRDGIGKELLLGREIRAGRIGAAALVAPRDRKSDERRVGTEWGR